MAVLEKDKPTPVEAVKLGVASRTSATWKRNGNLNTVGKELRRWNCERQPEQVMGEFRPGRQPKIRRRVNVSVPEVRSVGE